MAKDKDKKKDKAKNEGLQNEGVLKNDNLDSKEDLEKKDNLEKESDSLVKVDSEKEKSNENEGDEMAETVTMIWPHKRVTPGSVDTVFGYPATANEEGFLILELPKGQVKNEMLRPNKMVPLDLYNKKRELEEEAAKLYE